MNKLANSLIIVQNKFLLLKVIRINLEMIFNHKDI